jgi:hypothetical protein
MTLNGSCMCGAITYTSSCKLNTLSAYYHANICIQAEPLVSCLCHCIDCQKV